MSTPIQIIGIIKPKPGNTDAVIDGLAPLIEYVKANEPGVLQYHMFKQINPTDGEEVLVFIETFKDKQALDAHQQSPAYIALQAQAKEQDLLTAPVESKILQPVAGFASR